MTINHIIHDCVTGVKNKEFICTRAEFLNPFTDTRQPVIEHLSLSINDNANTMVLFGDNASGKSLICNLIESNVRKKSKHPIRAMSVGNRTSKSMSRAFIFGDEGRQSTGETSIRVIQKALNSAKSDNVPSLLIFDEPDLGLSSKYSRALGRYLAEQATELKSAGVYIIIISHNVPLLNTFIEALDDAPSYVGLNTTSTLDQWLTSDEEKTIDELLSLTQISRRKESAIDRDIENFKRNK
jgi:ABC-type molybdenum transport system ATPase subunit/photorepair protein PhrA